MSFRWGGVLPVTQYGPWRANQKIMQTVVPSTEANPLTPSNKKLPRRFEFP